MLCLARAISIWGNEIMPTFMASRAKKGFRPAICVSAEKMNWSPVMLLSTFSTANFANKWKKERVKLFDFDVRFFNSTASSEAGDSLTAVQTKEGVLWISSSINIVSDAPSFPTAIFARLVWIFDLVFPRGIHHEAMSILRK